VDSSASFVLVKSVTEDKVLAEIEHYKPRVLKASLSNEDEAKMVQGRLVNWSEAFLRIMSAGGRSTRGPQGRYNFLGLCFPGSNGSMVRRTRSVAALSLWTSEPRSL
jgi:hypothetical protein